MRLSTVNQFGFLVIHLCKTRGWNITPEHQFDPGRKWRFDYLIEHGGDRVGIEYEGMGVGKNKNAKGGHQTITGFSGNCDKYNAATVQGIRVLRYTVLNWKQVQNDLEVIFGV